MKCLAPLFPVLLLVGCATSASVSEGWSAPDPEGFGAAARPLVASEPVEPPPVTFEGRPLGEPREIEFPRHGLSVLMRYVTENRAAGGWAIGLEYGYRFEESFAAGAFAEYLGGDLDVGVAGLMGYWYPVRAVGIGVGPGIEKGEGEPERFLARVGVFYEFEEGKFFACPAIFADFMDDGDVALLLGGNLGMLF